jgi:hypothetical protein
MSDWDDNEVEEIPVVIPTLNELDTLGIPGKFVYSLLRNSSKIDCKVYPLVADNDAKFPFIIYKRLNLVSLNNKDTYHEDQVTMEFTIVSDTYAKSIELANIVRALIEQRDQEYGDFAISDARLNMATEDYSGNAFVQKLQIVFNLNYIN